MAADSTTASAIPPGWKIVKKGSVFKEITITAPNGYTAHLTNCERNPGNVLYMLAEALLAADGVRVDAMSQTLTVAELAKRSGVKSLTVMERIKEWGGGDVTLNQPINLIGLATAALAHGMAGGRGETLPHQTPMEDTSSGKTVGER